MRIWPFNRATAVTPPRPTLEDIHRYVTDSQAAAECYAALTYLLDHELATCYTQPVSHEWNIWLGAPFALDGVNSGFRLALVEWLGSYLSVRWTIRARMNASYPPLRLPVPRPAHLTDRPTTYSPTGDQTGDDIA